MARIFLAGLAGAVVYYIWVMMAWMVVPLHTPTIAGLPDEDAVTELLQSQQLETGVYVRPWLDEADMSEADSPGMNKHRQGPLFSIFYQRQGGEPMGPQILAGGFVIDLLAALIVACMLHAAVGGCCCNSYMQRVGFVSGFGFVVALVGHLSYYNWFNFPLNYTLAFCVDVIVGWGLAGLAIGAVIRPSAADQEKPATE